MPDLQTSYMGLKMPNPLIVSASGLTATVASVERALDAGAGAVVLKSLFEEDIAASVRSAEQNISLGHPEAEAYVHQIGMLHEPDAYLTLVEECIRRSDVPIIASLNCLSTEWWVDYAERIQNVGADALELNLSPLPMDPNRPAADVEDGMVALVSLARRRLTLPLAVKIGPQYSAPAHLAGRIGGAGANALVLFNRFYYLDIDVESLKFRSGTSLSSHEEFGPVLRWVGILADMLDIDIAASTGIHTAEDVIKVLLAGGNAAQLCSVLYRNSIDHLGTILRDLKAWMTKKGFASIADFHGRLSLEDDIKNVFYQRLQYVKALKSGKGGT